MKKLLALRFLMLSIISFSGQLNGQYKNKPFTDSFLSDSCTFETTGRNSYFILDPGYRLVLEGIEGKDKGRLVITVLNQTKTIGKVETRVVEEEESVNGNTVEISRNFFAFCKQTGSIYYFGEEVDIYKEDKIVSHEGAWVAVGNNKAGIAMPGLVLLGARYYQEIAPGVAMDRAEILSISETKKTPAGNFINCLKIEETTPLEVKSKSYKLYAPGIGLIKDEDLLLTKHGFIK